MDLHACSAELEVPDCPLASVDECGSEIENFSSNSSSSGSSSGKHTTNTPNKRAGGIPSPGMITPKACAGPGKSGSGSGSNSSSITAVAGKLSSSLEDLVTTFDAKITKVLRNMGEGTEQMAPVQVRTQEEVMNESE